MAAPSAQIQASIAASIPIIKATIANLTSLNTPPTFATRQEISARVQMSQNLALFSKTGTLATLVGTIVPATVDPLNAAVAAAQAVVDAAKTPDAYLDAVTALNVAQEAVVSYYVSLIS